MHDGATRGQNPCAASRQEALMRHSILVGTHGKPGAAGALRAAAVPVLAVSGKTVGLPGLALITTDFSTSSLNAARVAM